VYALSFPDDSFAKVFPHVVVEHLSEPQRAFKEIHQVLKKGGIFVVSDGDFGGNILGDPTLEVGYGPFFLRQYQCTRKYHESCGPREKPYQTLP